MDEGEGVKRQGESRDDGLAMHLLSKGGGIVRNSES